MAACCTGRKKEALDRVEHDGTPKKWINGLCHQLPRKCIQCDEHAGMSAILETSPNFSRLNCGVQCSDLQCCQVFWICFQVVCEDPM